MVDLSLLIINLSEDFGTFYKRCLDTLAKKNPGQFYWSSCTPKRISSGFWFDCFHGDNVYAVCYEFIDKSVKKLLYEFPAFDVQCENIDYRKGLPCISFYIINSLC